MARGEACCAIWSDRLEVQGTPRKRREFQEANSLFFFFLLVALCAKGVEGGRCGYMLFPAAKPERCVWLFLFVGACGPDVRDMSGVS